METRPDRPRKWLPPSAALNRFDLPPALVTPSAQPRRQTRYGFQVGGLGLLVADGTVSEVLDPLPVHALPHTAPWLNGLINLRGNLVPVFDLAALLGLAQSGGRNRRLLVLDRGETAVALPIDTLPRTVEPGRTLAHPPPLPSSLQDHVPRAYAGEGGVWLEFDHRSFFRALAEGRTGA